MRAFPARMAAAFDIAAKLLQSAIHLQLSDIVNRAASRILREFRNVEENSTCIIAPARLQVQTTRN
ncbi:hypothetical protein [Bradyrhizobium sp. ORS 111]|uniref:hypothetical protein n=1 Tax=Bradyrhizobium sp. ORS 111 TaxID=1685958 RepID=UPI00388D02F4